MTCRALLLLGCVAGFASSASAQNRLQKIPPSVQYGIEAYKEERFEEALEAFEKAQTHFSSNAQLEFNRGTTFFKQEKYNEALQSFSRARELEEGTLQGDIFYNMGNTYAALGKTAEAMASYRQALRANPQDSMARHNLEFLLSLPPPPPENEHHSQEKEYRPENTSSDSDAQEASSPQYTQDEKDASSSSDETKPPDKGPSDSKDTPYDEDARQNASKEDARQNSSKEDDGQNDANEKAVQKNAPEQGSPVPQGRQLGREEADKILDAFGMDEKNVEPWRFQQKPPVEEGPHEKYW